MLIKLARSITFGETNYGGVFLDQKKGTYWEVNESGAEIVQLSLQSSTVEDVARTMSTSHGLDFGEAVSDVAELLDSLIEAGLVIK